MTDVVPPSLWYLCRSTLLKCEELDTTEHLCSQFVVGDLYALKDAVPEAQNKADRADQLLKLLIERRSADHRPALIRFLELLRDKRSGTPDALSSQLTECLERAQQVDWANISGSSVSTDERSIIISYLWALDYVFREYEPRFVRLTIRSGKFNALPSSRRRRLQELEEFLRSSRPTVPHSRADEATRLATLNNTQPHYAPTPHGGDEVDVEHYLARCTRVVLLGQPGAGKSTTLRHLGRVFGAEWSEGPFANHRSEANLSAGLSGRIPIHAYLGMWSDPDMGLLQFLKAHLAEVYGSPELAERLPNLMRNGRVVLLLDALNEIPRLRHDPQTGNVSDPRADAIAALNSAEHAAVACVLSCRENDFRNATDWHDLHVLPLTRQQVEAFTEAYYEGDEDAALLKDGLLSMLYESTNTQYRKIRDIIAQPFYLVRVLDFYQLRRFLPSNPTALLTWSIQSGLKREVEERQLTTKEADELKVYLARLAFNMTDAAVMGTVSKGRAAGWLYRERPLETSYVGITKQDLAQPIDWSRVKGFNDVAELGHFSALLGWVGLGEAMKGLTKWLIPPIPPLFMREDFYNREEEEACSPISANQLEGAARIFRLAEGAGLLIETGLGVQFYHQLLQEYFCALYCSSNLRLDN